MKNSIAIITALAVQSFVSSRFFLKRRSFLAMAVASTAMLASPSAWAAASTDTWKGTSGSSDWATAGNFTYSSGSGPAAAGDALVFAGTNNYTTSNTLTNSLTAGTSFASITFNSGALAYTMTGNYITLGGNLANNSNALETFGETGGGNSGIFNSVASTFTLGGGITINSLTDSSNAAQQTNINGAGSLLTLTNFTLNSGANVVTDTFAGSGNITIGAIQGGGSTTNSLLFKGTGTLTLGGSNASTYTGTTTLTGGAATGAAAVTGTMEIASAGATGAGTLILANGTFDNSSGGALSISPAALTIGNPANGTAWVSFGGTNNISFNGTGSVATTVGTGTVLNLNNLGNIVGGSTLTVGPISTATTNPTTITVNGAGNNFVASSFSYSTGSLSFAGNGNITLTGGLSAGSGALTYNGLGNLTLSGTSAFTGATTLAHGTLALNGTTSSASYTVTGGILAESSSGVIGGTQTLTLYGGTPTVLGGAAILSGTNTSTGAVTAYVGSTVVLDFSGTGAPTTNILGSGATVKLAGGSLVLKGNPNATGTDSQTLTGLNLTTITQGQNTVVLNQNGDTHALNLVLGTISRSAGDTLDITLPTNGTVTATSGTQANASSSGLLATGTVATGVAYATANGGTTWATFASGTIGALPNVAGTGATGYATGIGAYLGTNNINVTNNDTLTASATVGSLRFNAANTGLIATGFTLTDNGGILVTPGSTGASITGGTLANSAATKELVILDYGSLNIASTITGATALTFAGTGVTTLSGVNSLETGAIVIDNGATLAATNSAALGTGTVTFGTAATLQLRNDSNTTFTGAIVAGINSTIDVNNAGTVGDVTSGKTLSFGTLSVSTQNELNVTGGNGYNLAFTSVQGPASGGTFDFNPTTANVTIGSFTGGATAAGPFKLNLDGTSAGNSIGLVSNGSGTLTTGINKLNTSTWNLTGASTFTGGIIDGGGTLMVSAGGGGSLNSANTLTLNGTSTFDYDNTNATQSNVTQSLGALASTAGDGTVLLSQSGNVSNTEALTFASLTLRLTGATTDFVSNGLANSTTGGSANGIVLTTAPATTNGGFINVGTFFAASNSASSNYAWITGSGADIRAIAYGSDTGAVTFGASTTVSGTYVQTTGAVSNQATGTFTSLNLNGSSIGSDNFTLANSATLTLAGILVTGNVANSGATISGGSGIAIGTSGSTDLVVRTDRANDSLVINTPISGVGFALVKSGAGTLTMGTSAVNTYTGNTYIDQGTLNISQDSSLGGAGAGNIYTVFLSGGTLQAGVANAGSTIALVANRNISLSATSGVQTIDTNGNTLVVNGAISGGQSAVSTSSSLAYSNSVFNKAGAGTLVLNGTNPYLSNTSVLAGTLQLGNGGTSGSLTSSPGITVASGATFAIDRSNAVTQGYDFLPAITGAGAVTQIGSGATTFNAANTYSGGTTVSAGKLYVNNTSGSGTGTGSVAVTTGGTLAGSGFIAPTTGAGVTLASGASLYSGAAQGGGPTIIGGGANGAGTGPGLTLNNTAGLSSILAVNSANLTFALGAGTTGINGGTATTGFDYTNPNADSTYLNVVGNKAGEINFTGVDTITIQDMTSNMGPFGATPLTLDMAGSYLLIQAALNSDYFGLVTSSGMGGGGTLSLDGNGYVVGVWNGLGGTNGWQTLTNDVAITILQQGANGAALTGAYAYPQLQLVLNNGDLLVVPEPGTWALMLGGLALLIVIQRRKNKLG